MLRQKKGQTTVEFALVIVLVFLPIVMVTIDFGILFFVNQTIQHAVRDGARYAVTGRNQPGLDLRTSMEAKIREQSMGLFDKNAIPNNIVIQTLPALSTIQTNTIYSGTTTTGTGASQSLISVEYQYAWHLLTPFLQPLFPNQRYTFTVKTYVVNEPS
jgi:Flp pilus assembly protein TadG